ncbi:hypothetical protein [Moorena sp. SIO3I6]|uniref:hypothetical protein n=1 Tax=Moorena sp. SIO3I6 TaxID=2607831 RepID=UPI0013FAB54C|nr:hypothetical protein [Moorena sp. SIO3I6]NEP28934.1 hypothetical protein [Moorena sp. SIO3I6]
MGKVINRRWAVPTNSMANLLNRSEPLVTLHLDRKFPIPDSRFPFPSWKGLGVGSNSRFPIPDSRFPIPDSRFPTPDSLLPTPYSLLPIPDYSCVKRVITLLDRSTNAFMPSASKPFWAISARS